MEWFVRKWEKAIGLTEATPLACLGLTDPSQRGPYLLNLQGALL